MKNPEFSFNKIPNKKSQGDGIEAGPRKILPAFIEFIERKELTEAQKESEIVYYQKKYKLPYKEARTFFHYAFDFDIRVEDMLNKKVVDIGSGHGNFKNALEKIGIDGDLITNLDRNLDDDYFKNTDVVGYAESLPLEDETFDVVLAHCSTPIMQATSQEYESIPRVISEMFRIAKKGGVIKIHPIAVVAKQKAPQQYKKDYLRMGSIVLEEIDKINKIDKDVKIKIIETKRDTADKDGFGIVWALELRK